MRKRQTIDNLTTGRNDAIARFMIVTSRSVAEADDYIETLTNYKSVSDKLNFLRELFDNKFFNNISEESPELQYEEALKRVVKKS